MSLPHATLSVAPFTGDPEEWNAVVEAASGWTHFHRFEWKPLIESVFRHECPYLGVRDGSDRLVGVLPLVRVRGIFGHYLVSMPFLNYGGPIGTPDGVQALTVATEDLAAGDRVKLVEFRSIIELPIAWPVSHRKITVMLDIPDGGSEALWSSFKAKLRSQIRRPEKAGVEVRFGSDQVDGFYHVFARHMRDLGTPVQGKRLFRAIADRFADSAWFGCAYLDGQPVAGGVGFQWGDELEMTWASSLREVSNIAPNMQLYWRFMERAANAGLTRFNFGRCTPGSGTHRFKRQWGSRDVPLYWYQRAAGEAASTPSPDDGAYSWGPRLWRHLPVSVATSMGPWIVRQIP